MLAIGVQRRLERGTTDVEIDAFVEQYGRTHHLLFTVNTLEYLAKGGRIGKAAAFAGNLLNVKPILTIRDGEVVPLKRVHGNQKAFQESAKIAADFDLKEYKREYDAAIATMKSKGIQVTVIDTAPWAQATKAAREELVSKIPDGQALYQEINTAKQASAGASK